MRKIFALVAAMLLCGCADSGNDEASAAQAAESVFSVTAEHDKPYQESRAEAQDNSEVAERELWRSEEFIGGSFYFLGSEYCETLDGEQMLCGALWFENESGAVELLPQHTYLNPTVVDCGGVKLLIVDKSYATYSISCVFSVVGGDAVEVPIKGFAQMSLAKDENGSFTAISSEFEGNMAHTWKTYWYDFSAEDMAFIPVGGNDVGEEAVPDETSHMIADCGGSISGVIEFDNGIIAVNYIAEEYGAEFQYYRLCQNGADITPDDNRGHYKLP